MSDLPHIINLSQFQECEISVCFVKTLNKVVISIYRSPQYANVEHLVDTMSRVLNFEEKIGPKFRILVTGDFNVHYNRVNDINTQKVIQLFLLYGLKQLTYEATHEKGNCIDKYLVTLM